MELKVVNILDLIDVIGEDETKNILSVFICQKNPEIENFVRNSAVDFAKRYGVVTVLKGSGTIIASPDGKILINRTGNSGMATGGSGDVLAGMAGSLLAQGAKAFNAASAAVYLHGLAGDLTAEKLGRISMLPTDLIDEIPQAFRKCSF